MPKGAAVDLLRPSVIPLSLRRRSAVPARRRSTRRRSAAEHGTNRWGYVATKTPEQTMKALALILPKRYRVEINKLLVTFGKHVCTGVRPRCSTCPVLDMCRQVGVASHRRNHGHRPGASSPT